MTARRSPTSALIALLPALAIAACSSDGIPAPRVVAEVHLRPHARVNLPAGDSLRFVVTALDGNGRVMFDHPQLSLTAPAALGAITGDRLTASSVADSAWVHVVAASGARDSVFVVTYTPSGSYHITLQFAPDVPERWRIALAWAASVWEAAIAGSLPAVQLNSAGADCPTAPDEPTSPPQMGVETGMRLYVGQSGHYPAGTYVEATGGPCVQRPLPAPTTVLGQISLNRDKPVDAIPPERLEYLALHEMGHTLGLVA
ncbi:MAG TPA: hypothetical protein VKH19_08260, partial [Gemmatimonadaceae bacterium]|nr:hypothetical protein [Gemmatimonadaceae bacterium]